MILGDKTYFVSEFGCHCKTYFTYQLVDTSSSCGIQFTTPNSKGMLLQ